MALRITFSMARRNSSLSPSSVTGPLEARSRPQPWACASIEQSSTRPSTSSSIRRGSDLQTRRLAFSAGDFEHLADQRVKPVSFLLDPVERRRARFIGSRQFDGDTQASQGTAELMRNIEEETALRGQQGLNMIRHAIEGRGQVAQLIVTRFFGARGQIATPQPVDRGTKRRRGAVR